MPHDTPATEPPVYYVVVTGGVAPRFVTRSAEIAARWTSFFLDGACRGVLANSVYAAVCAVSDVPLPAFVWFEEGRLYPDMRAYGRERPPPPLPPPPHTHAVWKPTPHARPIKSVVSA